MASLRSFATRKATFFEALILMASPVAGLRPMRAARLRTCRMPRPVRRTLFPFFRFFTVSSTKSLKSSVAAFLDRPCFSASSAISFDIGIVGGVAVFVAAAAFAAGALAAGALAAGALAAAFAAGAFLAAGLVAMI